MDEEVASANNRFGAQKNSKIEEKSRKMDKGMAVTTSSPCHVWTDFDLRCSVKSLAFHGGKAP